jgi:hypothetical protein
MSEACDIPAQGNADTRHLRSGCHLNPHPDQLRYVRFKLTHYRDGHLTVPMVSHVADHLMETAYRLPFGPGGFEQWARENDLLSNQ